MSGALLTDLPKAFNCIKHGFLTAKLTAYGFDCSSLQIKFSCKTTSQTENKEQKLMSCEILFGVPQDSMLGPLLFDIPISDMF